MEIFVAHGIPYAATACPSYPEDLMNKVKHASSIKGSKFIHVLSPCPIGWGYPSEYTVKVGRLAVESSVFPLYEVYDGELYVITQMPKSIPVKDYLTIQSRFRFLKDDEIEMMQKNVDKEWENLVSKSRRSRFTKETG